MTELIIINGVDVSGCGYLLDPKEPECIIQGLGTNETINCCSCRDNPNCYYKQLKRKEQECERLANQYNRVVKQNRQLQIDNTYYKVEIAKFH